MKFATRMNIKKMPKGFFFLMSNDGFGGLVPKFAGSNPAKPLDFSVVKILSMPSFGGEVKASVPCPSFAACKRT
jgi:hypothetical protein